MDDRNRVKMDVLTVISQGQARTMRAFVELTTIRPVIASSMTQDETLAGMMRVEVTRKDIAIRFVAACRLTTHGMMCMMDFVPLDIFTEVADPIPGERSLVSS